MPLYLGPNQVAECMRSGEKCLAGDLVRDGRNPELLVLPEWADPPHPQEKPFIPDDIEGAADYPQAPDNLPPTGLQLIGVYSASGPSLRLTWNQARLWGPRAKTYTLRRSVDGGAYSNISVNLVDYTNSTGHVAGLGIVRDYGNVYYVNTTYTDSAITTGPTYTYQVAAVDDIGDDVAVSNTLTLHNGVVTGNPAGGDASFANVVLLLHGDGANNGAVFTDSSVYNHAMVNGPGNPHVFTQTSVVKFGTAAIYGPSDNGNPMGITTPAVTGPEWNIANTALDFTLECWFQQVAYDSNKSPIIFALGDGTFSGQILMFPCNGGGYNFLRAFGGSNGNVWDTYLSGPKPVISSGVWYFATLMRKNNVYYLFSDGVLLSTATPSGTLLPPLYVSVASSATTGSVDQIYVDEMRFTVGVARYPTTGFTPPTAAFPNY